VVIDVRAKGAKAETDVKNILKKHTGLGWERTPTIEEEATAHLYCIAHKSLPIIYIGLTKDYKTRFREHKNDSSNKLLKHYIVELGADSFDFILLLEDKRSHIEYLEAICIKEIKKLNEYIVCNILEGSVFTGESCQKGEDHWNAKFTEQDILNIRNTYALGGITQKKLGEIYSVSNKIISKITRGDRWKNVSGSLIKNSASNRVANRRKLTDDKVVELRNLAKAEYDTKGSVNIPSMADSENISRQSMRLVLKGISYSSIPGPILGVDFFKEFGR
jgi:hypothetical protein